MENRTHDENVKKLLELIKDVNVAMLTTIENDRQLRSRPMATMEAKPDGQLWFFTGLDSSKVGEIQRDQHVNLSYADPKSQVYVSISGSGRIVRDRAKMEELWSPIHKAWFPKGLEDPNIALLQVDIEQAEYWDSPSSKVVQLIGFVKAIATGKPYGEEATDHQKLKL